MKRNQAHVQEQIDAGNPWYTQRQSTGRYLSRQRWKIKERHALIRGIVMRRLADRGTQRILDAGCGDGNNLDIFKDIKEADVWGCDYNPERVAYAAKRFPEFQIVEANLLDPKELEEGSFDIILNYHMIEHVHEDADLLAGLGKLLKPSGILILGTPNEGCLMARLRNHVLEPQIMKTTDHVQFYTDKAIRSRLFEPQWQVQSFFPEYFFMPHQRIAGWFGSSPRRVKFLKWCARIWPSQCAGLLYVLHKSSVPSTS